MSADRVAIVGSREWSDLERVRSHVRGLPAGTIVVSGGARGVDTAAEQAARERGLEVRVHRPDWARHGNAAGVIRNGEIVADCTRVVAFWDGRSRGTFDTLNRAHAAGLPVEIVRANGAHDGFSATPERTDRRPLGDTFERMVVVATPRELVDAGFLVTCDADAASTP